MFGWDISLHAPVKRVTVLTSVWLKEEGSSRERKFGVLILSLGDKGGFSQSPNYNFGNPHQGITDENVDGNMMWARSNLQSPLVKAHFKTPIGLIMAQLSRLPSVGFNEEMAKKVQVCR